MANQSIITCTGCKTSLATRPELAGKKIRCPRCQTINQVGVSAAAPAAAPPTSSGPDKVVTGQRMLRCGQCGAKLAVSKTSQATAFRCPKCQNVIRDQSTATSDGPSRSVPTQATPSPVVESFQWPETPLPSANWEQTSNPTLPRGLNARSSANKTNKLVHLAKRFWMSILIAMLNILFLIVSMLLSDGGGLLFLSAIQIFFAAVLIGMLFLPRLHIVGKATAILKEFMSVSGTAIARCGSIFLLLLALKGGSRLLKQLNRAQDRGTIDSSQLSQFSMDSLASILIGLVVTIAVLTAVVFLWHWIGLVRVLATAYLLQLVCFLSVLIFAYSTTGTLNPTVDRSFATDRTGIPGNDNYLTPPPFGTAAPPGPRNFGMQPPNPLNLPFEEVATIVLEYSPVADAANIKQIQTELLDETKEFEWIAKQNARNWILTIKWSGSIQSLNERIQAKRVTTTRAVNETCRFLVLHPQADN